MSTEDDTRRRPPGATDDTEAAQTSKDAPAAAIAGYDLGAVLGRGGMGEVVAAIDRRIERGVAVKRMRGESSPDAVARFLREARIQARLDHPAIVPVHEVGEDADGRPYFTMKQLAGVTLAQRLVERGPIQPLLRALVDVCFAVELAHSRGVVHRDLKPSNIMLGDYGEVYVIDWGVARVTAASRSSSVKIDIDSLRGDTATGALLGTPGYMPPEQIRGEDVTGAADVYALGAILFEILAGEPLHPGGRGAIGTTLAGVTDTASSRRPDRHVPPELDALCSAALVDDPAARPRARELAERIQQYLDGDRDVEHRRALARDSLAAARAALASGDLGRRSDAVRAAGRALALDPQSTEAAELVTQLIVEPPRELPQPLTQALDDAEARANRELSRRAIRVYLAIYLWALFLPFLNVTSWTLVIAVFAVATGMAAMSWINTRTGRLSIQAVLVGNMLLALLFSRVVSPFVLMPVLVAGIGFRAAGREWAIARPKIVIGWAIVTMIAPFVLEWAGVFAPTWSVDGHTLRVWGTITQIDGNADAAALLFGNLALVAVVVGYATRFHSNRHDIQRRLFIQAWHLKHLLPSETGQLR